MNVVILQGRITANPELKKTNTGKSVTQFVLAVDRYTKETDFLTCVAWNTAAENIVKYFAKGDKITIQGNIQTRKYEKKDGSTAIATEIIIDRFDFCEAKKEPKNDAEPNFEEVDVNGELPF